MYYLVKVKFETLVLSKKGAESVKVNNEQYLVNALSVTEAEAKTVIFLKGTIIDFEVTSSSQTKILEVIK